MSRTSDEVSWETHQNWFAKALADPRRTILVGEIDGKPVGMVRLDHDGETEVSINVAPLQRGLGVGRALLEAALGNASGPLVAEVRADNAASRSLFEGVGFEPSTVKDGHLIYRRG